MDVDDTLRTRAERHAALGEPARLAIVDELTVSDRSPSDLGRLLGLPSNLLAHHLDVLDEVGLVERIRSAGDRRRRYVRLRHEALTDLGIAGSRPTDPVVFVCTHNSARSQLAAALWERRTGGRATSAGTDPADHVHPGAVAAAARVGLDLSHAIPRAIDDAVLADAVVVTVCDRAHEDLARSRPSWHWSTPDPVDDPRDDVFDEVVRTLDDRINALT